MDAPREHALSDILLWVLIGVYFAASLADKIHPNAAFGVTFVVVAFVFALIHGWQRYGTRVILVFLAICLVVSFSLENTSIVTGFPFGHYVYAAVPGPRLYSVPALIALAYFGSGYVSWVVANVLLGKVDGDPRSSVARFALPIAAAFIMVMWDVGMDPNSSTVQRLWIWRDGGGFFGVPLSNFLGWFLTVFLFYELFALCRSWQHGTVRSVAGRSHWFQATILYVLVGMSQVYGYLLQRSDNLISVAGRVWSASDMRETSVVVFLFTMLFVGFLAGIRILQDG